MKQKDIVVILVVGFVAAIASLLLTKTFFVTKESKDISVEVVDPITSDFKLPDNTVFNDKAINPTQLIKIGDTF
jgi:hypothetical protein